MLSFVAQESCVGGIDWPKFWELLWAGAAPVIVGAAIALIALIGRWRLYSLQQSRLHALALCRRSGVVLRNEGKRIVLTGSDSTEWQGKANKWKKELFKTAQRFSRVEAERLDTLDWMEAKEFEGVEDSEQLRLLRDINETLKRLQDLLEERVRPYFTP